MGPLLTFVGPILSQPIHVGATIFHVVDDTRIRVDPTRSVGQEGGGNFEFLIASAKGSVHTTTGAIHDHEFHEVARLASAYSHPYGGPNITHQIVQSTRDAKDSDVEDIVGLKMITGRTLQFPKLPRNHVEVFIFHTYLMHVCMVSSPKGHEREPHFVGKARTWDVDDLRLFRRAFGDILHIRFCIHDGVVKAMANDPHLKRSVDRAMLTFHESTNKLFLGRKLLTMY